MDRIILSTEALNLNGFRVLTKGIDLSAFKKNPVMLYDHRTYSWLPIGKWLKPKIENGQLTAEPEFDPNDEEAMKVKSKFEGGYLNAASIGFRILARSDDPKDMVPGQRYPTVTKCLLYEASITPIPANSDAVRLYKENGELIDMKDEKAVEMALSLNHKNDMPGTTDNPNPERKPFLQQAKNMINQLSALVNGQGTPGDPAPADPQLSGNLPAVPATPAPSAPAVPTPDSALNTQVAQLQADIATRDAQISQLNQQLAARDALINQQGNILNMFEGEIKRLSGKPADSRLSGQRSDTLDLTDKKDQDKILTKVDHEVRAAFEREEMRRKKPQA